MQERFWEKARRSARHAMSVIHAKSERGFRIHEPPTHRNAVDHPATERERRTVEQVNRPAPQSCVQDRAASGGLVAPLKLALTAEQRLVGPPIERQPLLR